MLPSRYSKNFFLNYVAIRLTIYPSKLQSANVISSALSKNRVSKKQDELSEIKEKLLEHGFSSVDELLELLSSKRWYSFFIFFFLRGCSTEKARYVNGIKSPRFIRIKPYHSGKAFFLCDDFTLLRWLSIIHRQLEKKIENILYSVTEVSKTSKCDVFKLREYLYRHSPEKYGSLKDVIFSSFQTEISF